MRRGAKNRYFLAANALFLANAIAQTQFSEENAYNPVPSPDGNHIAAVRTGWFRRGGSGGLGRSNLVSEVIILDRSGHTVSAQPLGKNFIAGWTSEGIATYRDWAFALVSENGAIRQQGRTCSEDRIKTVAHLCAERAIYLPGLHSFVWINQKSGDSVLMTSAGEFTPHHRDKFLGEQLAPSPDQRYIAAGPGPLGRLLSIYDIHEKRWIEMGAAILHPDRGWDWMRPNWSPWFADSPELAYFTDDGLIVTSPDGQRKRIIVKTSEPAGLAVPSPDGRAIAYATFASTPRNPGDIYNLTWKCTGIWIVGIEPSAQPHRLTGPILAVTYDLRWLDNETLIFDRVEQGIPPKAHLWTVAAKH